MILEIDWGNSRIKWRLREDSGTLASGLADDLGALSDQWRSRAEPLPDAVWVASVRPPSDEWALVEWSDRLLGCEPWFARSSARCGAVLNGYHAPEQLGVDRWLALLAAREAGAVPTVIVQAGTALTTDVMDAAGRHLGGYIGPGRRLMKRSLRQGTAGVRPGSAPLSLVPGRTTAAAVEAAWSAMVRGVVDAALEALDGRQPRVILSGGDAAALQSILPSSQLWPEIVLDGLAFAREG